MEAGKLWMIRDFIGQTKVLFKIPVYQRNYDWKEQNCSRLWDDIEKILKTGEKHFLGSIVFMSSKEASFALPQYTIIDGQQRLTTIMISLKAIAEIAKTRGDQCYLEIENTLLHNQYCDEEFKIKLKPIKSDNDEFVALLNSRFEKLSSEGHIYRNYTICEKRINSLVNHGFSPSDILQAMFKLEIVYIQLREGEDDPQVIFESINSTGLDLRNADLIRNFLLMNAKNQETLYENYWLEIEKMLKPGIDYENLDQFFMHYIVFKTDKRVKGEPLYDSFVRFYKTKGYNQESILKELKYYAEIFQAFVFDTEKYSMPIRNMLKSLRVLKQTTCFPFLFHVFEDYEQNIIDENTLTKTLKLLLTYLVRRAVCGVSTSSLRGFFSSLYNRVFKVESNKTKYYESVLKFLHSVVSKDIMPSDLEFEQNLLNSNIYSNVSLCKFLLMDIENGDSKETLDADSLTIEHIMPQRLGVEWRHISAEDHEKYLHVLGNLSVTGYNSELSNKSFAEKRAIIKENSKAIILNSDVWDQEQWNISNIVSRGKRLTEILMQRFSIEKDIDPNIEFEYLTEITLTKDIDVTGAKLVMFKFAGEVYRQKQFILMFKDMLKLLDRRHPGTIETLAHDNYCFWAKNHPYVSETPEKMRVPFEMKPNVFVETNLSSYIIIRFLNTLFDKFGEDKSLFSFYIISEETDDEDDGDEE